jgi:hypothetical protein
LLRVILVARDVLKQLALPPASYAIPESSGGVKIATSASSIIATALAEHLFIAHIAIRIRAPHSSGGLSWIKCARISAGLFTSLLGHKLFELKLFEIAGVICMEWHESSHGNEEFCFTIQYRKKVAGKAWIIPWHGIDRFLVW